MTFWPLCYLSHFCFSFAQSFSNIWGPIFSKQKYRNQTHSNNVTYIFTLYIIETMKENVTSLRVCTSRKIQRKQKQKNSSENCLNRVKCMVTSLLVWIQCICCVFLYPTPVYCLDDVISLLTSWHYIVKDIFKSMCIYLHVICCLVWSAL